MNQKLGKMRTGCRKKGPKLRVSAIKTHIGPKAIIPVYAVKPWGPRKKRILPADLAMLMN